MTVKKSFDFATLRSCTKYIKVKCVSQNCAWMFSDRFRIYKCIGEHSCCVEHVKSSHIRLSINVIASFCVNMYCDSKDPNAKEIQRTILNSFRCSPSY